MDPQRSDIDPDEKRFTRDLELAAELVWSASPLTLGRPRQFSRLCTRQPLTQSLGIFEFDVPQ